MDGGACQYRERACQLEPSQFPRRRGGGALKFGEKGLEDKGALLYKATCPTKNDDCDGGAKEGENDNETAKIKGKGCVCLVEIGRRKDGGARCEQRAPSGAPRPLMRGFESPATRRLYCAVALWPKRIKFSVY